MASECSQEAILDFLRDRGGRVKTSELTEHFKAVFPEEPEKKAEVRDRFKTYVDNVAFVKAESGVKYVCLKRRFRGSAKEQQSPGTETGPEHVLHEDKGSHGGHVGQVTAAAKQQTAQGSGYGSDSQVRAPRDPPPTAEHRRKCHEFVGVAEELDGGSGEMGNTESFRRQKRNSRKEQAGKAPDLPEISVTEASPLPAQGSVFTLPGPVQTGGTGQADAETAGLSPLDTPAQTDTPSPAGLKEEEHIPVVSRCRNSRGSQHRCVSTQPGDDVEDEGQFDTHSLCGSDDSSTPKGSRKHFLQVMMNTSPQVRRSIVLRRSIYLSSRSDSDSASLVSSNPDEDRTSVTLDPLEHEWMMCASDGEWGSLNRLLATDPSLILRKDFVTGFTCLHWAAKHGKPELIALIINFAKQNNIPISVDVRSSTGYTPLHVAAMHNHMEVVKLLVGAYSADVEIRDYSGRKACQYLTDSVSVDIRDIIGAYEQSNSENAERGDGRRWRFSKVLQSNLKPLRLLNPADCDSVDGEGRPREKPLRRKSSLSRMKPKLHKLRLRTSQIVHSTSFRDSEELDGSVKGSFKSRPKTHFFG
ncbi:ankyrin repeat domain-containing protein SOWAHC-like [Lates calcarifer]|uniref:Ankyrin repeat domain-containing protein SOWAHC-like n=1 Tax=Lates calcarifer TaxID=8187 RepID=A0A4W6EGP1_LATCA|nr:ankyrin repeat domain-containing protein SOWAHC-like [Lates calcarifer]